MSASLVGSEMCIRDRFGAVWSGCFGCSSFRCLGRGTPVAVSLSVRNSCAQQGRPNSFVLVCRCCCCSLLLLCGVAIARFATCIVIGLARVAVAAVVVAVVAAVAVVAVVAAVAAAVAEVAV
eukprot:7363251-Alexandrium_andersonii.AAC.1